jgi:hypothetical protein
LEFEDQYYDRLEDLIFHFTTRAVAFEHILYNRTLKLGLRSEFDDIAESSKVVITVSSKVGPAESEAEVRAIGDKITKLQRFSEHGLRALCFCSKQTTDYPGFVKSPRMWSQYANGQNGVCLVFSKTKLIETILSGAENPNDFQFGDVEYCEYPMNHGITLSRAKVLASSDEELHRLIFFESHKHIFFQKHANYIDEKEFRIVYAGYLAQKFVRYGESLLAVVLGKEVSGSYDPIIEKLIDEGVSFYKNGYVVGYPNLREYKPGTV